MPSLALSPAGFLTEPRGPLPSTGCAAAAACAARRAAAMKLDVLTFSLPFSRLAAGISLMALSEAAMRSDGEAVRPVGRVPGSSG